MNAAPLRGNAHNVQQLTLPQAFLFHLSIIVHSLLNTIGSIGLLALVLTR